jgi:hypothetical protein
MQYVNSQTEVFPLLQADGAGARAFLHAVLTRDDAGLYAVYVAIIDEAATERADTMEARHALGYRVAHSGVKQTYARAVQYFPNLPADEYRR